MRGLAQNLKLGVRQFWQSPGFTLTVVLTLALSIGANTAIFSIVNALLLKDFPYAHPERIGAIYTRVTGSRPFDGRRNLDGEQWEMLRDNVSSLASAISGVSPSGMNLRDGSHVQFVLAGRVSAHYFEVLGINPILGRNLSEEEDRPHGPKSVILSYRFWHAAFGMSHHAMGQTILLKGEPYTIIGVLPQGAVIPLNADIYISLQPSREGEGEAPNFLPIIRLRDSATWQQADAEMNRAWANTARTRRLANSSSGAQVTYFSVPLQKSATETLRPKVLALMLAAGFILLIACANLAGLTLARMSRRTREITTRVALGASRWRIQRQLWIESLMLAFVGGIAGIGVGFLALRGLLLLLPEDFLPVTAVPLDGRVLGFTLSLSLLTSILFGMLPAFTVRKANLLSAMASRAVARGTSVRLRQGLIAGEVALTVVLLAAAGLLIRTLIHFETMSSGFNPTGLMSAKASLNDPRYYEPAVFRKLLNESLVSLRQMPSVQSAAVGLSLPYEEGPISGFSLSDSEELGQGFSTDEVYVTPTYFETLQIPVAAGRTFTEADNEGAQRVAVINQAFARKFFHGANPVGRSLSQKDKKLLIVGVVSDTVGSSTSRLKPNVAPLTSDETVYVPAAQIDDSNYLSTVHTWFQPNWIIRTAHPVENLMAQMQRAMSSADPNLPFSGFYSMDDLMGQALAMQKVEVALLVAMSLLALLLSTIGISALVANLVVQRTREIGIRIALGSTVPQAMLHIGGPSVMASTLGLLLGLILCTASLRALRSVLYGVGVYDIPTIFAVVLVLAFATFIATTVSTMRVARIDPAKTLREE
ncbi:MAG TPA: ADOP family duplicated permease [Candidatus Angelobacter sp.]|nr:ADOP family duplicated permease [Candidatus Angelobacter sp.]